MTPPTDTERITGGALLVRELTAQGVEVIFGYPGGAIMPVYDALVGAPIRHVLTRHEQAAALAAGGYARSSGRVGVCLATSGPGATNLLTGIADAYLDSVPLVAITGQVATGLMGTDAFQEVDTFGMSLPVVKHSYVVRRIEDLAATVGEAFHLARDGRPGPVLIDLPKDVTTALVPDGAADGDFDRVPCQSLDDIALAAAAAMLASARRPLVYAGGGIAMSGAVDDFRAFVEARDLPVVTTLHGIGNLPTDHPLLLGMLGMHGTHAANLAVHECDLLLAIGARFDDRATGKLNEFAPGASVIHVDVDPAELGKLRQPHVSVAADAATVLCAWPGSSRAPSGWLQWCAARREMTSWDYDAPGAGVYAPAFLRELTARDPGRWTVACDVGQHQMWVAQHCHFANPEQHLSSGGLGTMGFGIPAAIGAQFAHPDRDIVAVSGDGSFLMNVQELATLRRYDLPIKIIVLDNSGLGMVRQWQQLFFAERYSEVDLSDNPDFAAVAAAFGIPALRVARRRDVPNAIDRIERAAGPLLVHVPIDARENVWPLVPPGSGNQVMMEEPPRCNASA